MLWVGLVLLVLAVLQIAVLAPLVALLGVGWALYKIIEIDWNDEKKAKEGRIKIAILSTVLLIALVAYHYLGKWGAIIALFLMARFLIWED